MVVLCAASWTCKSGPKDATGSTRNYHQGTKLKAFRSCSRCLCDGCYTCLHLRPMYTVCSATQLLHHTVTVLISTCTENQSAFIALNLTWELSLTGCVMLQVLDHDDRSHELLAVTAVDFCYSVIDSYTLLEPHTPHKPRKDNLSWLCLCRELDLDTQRAAC